MHTDGIDHVIPHTVAHTNFGALSYILGLRKMPRLSNEAWKTVILLKARGLTVKEIMKRLEEQQMYISRSAIFRFLRKYRNQATIGDLPILRQPKKLPEDQLVFIDKSLVGNDELTARQLHHLLQERWPETVCRYLPLSGFGKVLDGLL